MRGDKTIEYYKKRASEYDKVYYRDNPGRQAELARLYQMSRQVLADRHVLDLACGTGFWTKIISQSAASIVGLDINRATLVEAEKKEYDCPTRFIKADLRNSPLQPNSFDGFLATYLLSHVRREKLKNLGQSVNRMLINDSPAFICDNNLICERQPELIWDNQHINSYKKRKLENGEEYLILKNYFGSDEIVDILSKWGTIENFHYEDYYWAVQMTL